MPHLVRGIPLQTQIQFVSQAQRERIAGFDVEILDPLRRGLAADPNSGSMVLKVLAGHQRLLFTGDMSRAQEAMLAGRVGQVDILKVAHHGSASSTSRPWLQELSPRIAVISSGRRNPFGHPHAAALRRLLESGAEVHRTDLKGCVFVPL